MYNKTTCYKCCERRCHKPQGVLDLFSKVYMKSLRDFAWFWIFFFYELFIVGTETGDVKPVLTVKTEKDDMSCTSYHEGRDELRYWKMSPKQEDVTRGWWFTKDIFELF